MTSSFALLLDHDGIVLLHRTASGWRRIGDATLDAPDLKGRLAHLRARAETLSGTQDLTSILVLPAPLVLYTRTPAGSGGAEDAADRVAATLDGATPYALEDLVWDWIRDGDEIAIAAVARETLEEAESFAAEHHFAPVAFTATPDESIFPAAPFFGPTQAAADLLAAGDAVSREVAPIRPSEKPEPAPAPAAPAAVEVPAAPAPTDAAPDSPEEAPAEAVGPPDSAVPDDGQTLPEPAEVATPGTTGTSGATGSPEPDEIEIGDVPPVTFSSIRARQEPPVTAAPGTRKSASPSARTGSTARVAPLSGNGQSRGGRTTSPTSAAVPRSAPPVPPRRGGLEADALTVFGSLKSQKPPRRLARRGVIAPLALAAALGLGALWWLLPRAPVELAGSPPPEIVTLAPSPPAAPAGGTGSVGGAPTEPVITRAQDEPAPLDEQPAETDSAAIEPATPPADTAAGGGESAVAEDLTDTAPDVAMVGVAEEAATDEVLATSDPELAAEPEPDPETAAAPAIAPAQTDTAGADLDPASVAMDSSDPAAARAAYAVSGIWQRAPDPGFAPDTDLVDDLYIASIDPAVASQDPLSLFDPAARIDSTPVAPPPPFAPRPDAGSSDTGAVDVRTGPPPVVPPRRPEGLAPETDAAAPEEVAPAVDEALRGKRPRTRPGGLVETTEKAVLGGRTRAELATLRPKPRPASVQETAVALEVARKMADAQTREAQEAAEAETPPAGADTLAADLATATRRAVASSPEPRLRPANIAQIADRARQRTAREAAEVAAAEAEARAEKQAAAQARAAAAQAEAAQRAVEAAQAEAARAAAEQAASAEEASASSGPAVPRSERASPTAPTPKSVAQRATEKNALALNRVSLVGVFGTSNDRRALVRLPSGKYVKVKVGDRIDGGRVAAIGQSDLHYQKGGRTLTLSMPKG